MSSHFTIDVEKRLVFKTHVGAISPQDTVKVLEEVVSDPTFQKGMNFYCDYTRASVEWTEEETERFRQFVTKLKYLTGKCRWAVLFAPGADTRTADTFVRLHDSFKDSIEVKIFTDRDEASRWLDDLASDTSRIVVGTAKQ